MKKNALFLIIASMAITVHAQWYWEGSGTESDPYIIVDEQGLLEMTWFEDYGSEPYFRLDAPIVSPPDFEPIEEFRGTLIGNGNVIYLNNTSLMLDNFGTITDLGIIIEYVGDGPESETESFGALACNNYGIINSCFVYGSITNIGKGCIGGLIGTNNLHPLYNCKSYIYIESNGDAVGGIAGLAGPGMQRCYTFGTITGNKNVGGICGIAGDGTLFSMNHSYVMVYGEENAGGLIGSVNDHIWFGDAYAHGVVKGKKNIGGMLGYIEGELIQKFDAIIYSAVIVDNRDTEKNTAGYLIGVGDLNQEYYSTIYVDHSLNDVIIKDYMDAVGTGSFGAPMEEVDTYELMRKNFYDGISSHDAYPYFLQYPWFVAVGDIYTHEFDFVDSYLIFLGLDLDFLIKWECFGLHSCATWSYIALLENYRSYPDCNMFNLPDPEPPCLAGSGTSADPYQISTPEQLDCMMNHLLETNGTGEHFRIIK